MIRCRFKAPGGRRVAALLTAMSFGAWLSLIGPAQGADPLPAAQQPYWLEADVSMRSIRVDMAFSGARIVVFGAVNQPPGAALDTRALDVVAVIEGPRTTLTVRRKSDVLGLWLNTDEVEFGSAPRYYAVLSTRPPEVFAPQRTLAELGIGPDDVPIVGLSKGASTLPTGMADDFRRAAISLGARGHHFVRRDTALSFVGSSLFRGEVDLPGNIPIGGLDVRVYLFGDGKVLARHDTHLELEREGLEHVVYTFAHRHAFIYGLATVLMSACVGLFASFLTSRRLR